MANLDITPKIKTLLLSRRNVQLLLYHACIICLLEVAYELNLTLGQECSQMAVLI